MKNELLFVIQIIVMVSSVLGALRLGKSALTALICLLTVCANLLVLQQITLFGLTVTATDAFVIGIMLSFNLLQEYYGKQHARKALWTSMSALGLYTLLTHIHVAYQPSPHDQIALHYRSLLLFMPRLAIASITSYLVAATYERYIYGLLKHLLHGRFFILRNYASLLSSQLLDTCLFSFLGLYGHVASLLSIIIVSYTVKVAVITLSTPFLSLARTIHKNSR